MTLPFNLDEAIEAAEKATGGVWTAEESVSQAAWVVRAIYRAPDGSRVTAWPLFANCGAQPNEWNAKFAASVSPTNFLALAHAYKAGLGEQDTGLSRDPGQQPYGSRNDQAAPATAALAMKTMTLTLTDEEMAALEEIAKAKDLPYPRVFRSMIAKEQLVVRGLATFVHDSGPLSTPISPDLAVGGTAALAATVAEISAWHARRASDSEDEAERFDAEADDWADHDDPMKRPRERNSRICAAEARLDAEMHHAWSQALDALTPTPPASTPPDTDAEGVKMLITPERLREKIDTDPDSCVEARTGERCHANRDGECFAKNCPQLRDGEPEATGRHCPIDTYGELEEDGGR